MTDETDTTTETNEIVAQAATVTSEALNQTITLIGIFSGGAAGDAVLLRDETGAITRLEPGHLQPATGGPIRLIDTGDGWAMFEQAGAYHRLVMG